MKPDAPTGLSAVSAELLRIDDGRSRKIIYTIAAAVVAAGVWSNFATVLEVSVGSGKVIPEDRLQVVQTPDGGSVVRILSKPGQRVKKGEVIALLDPVYANSEVDENQQQKVALELAAIRLAEQLRLSGEGTADPDQQLGRINPDDPGLPIASKDPAISSASIASAARYPVLIVPERIRTHYPDLVRQTNEQFTSALRELASSMAVFEMQIAQSIYEKREAQTRLRSLNAAIRIARQDVKSLEQLLKSGAAGRAEVNDAKARLVDLESNAGQTTITLDRLDAAAGELEGRLAERLNGFRKDTTNILSETQVKLGTLDAAAPALAQKARNATIAAPMDGILKTLKLTTIGQVVRPGDEVAEVVPSSGSLLIQAKIRAEDIAFVEPGMPALIKLSAYDFSIFGALAGKVEKVASDSISDEKGNNFYLIDVRASSDFLERHGERWPVKIGMIATVDVVTGHQTVLQYFTKPIHRMTQTALRER